MRLCLLAATLNKADLPDSRLRSPSSDPWARRGPGLLPPPPSFPRPIRHAGPAATDQSDVRAEAGGQGRGRDRVDGLFVEEFAHRGLPSASLGFPHPLSLLYTRLSETKQNITG